MDEGKSVAVYVGSATRELGCSGFEGVCWLDAKAEHARQVSAGNANSYLILRLLNPTNHFVLAISVIMATSLTMAIK